MSSRKCNNCGIDIKACFGFVNAGDFVSYIKGHKKAVRELCGKCVFVKEKEINYEKYK